ncbi:zinc finger protein 771 [Drosophila grimshawi]|uniref:GH17750 n=1 Tax=Drosophila grimshawi TaxID=7222 RepID=B4JXL3_DROGR|nr:zinc finger protein 771 [Drosophila grimshawi]EDV95112.1 GH17750 [Drosophila grimshawi]
MSNSEDTLEKRAEHICRVCNVPSLQTLSLFQPHMISGELTTLAAQLSYCTSLQVLEEEHFLPSQICKRCVVLLTQLVGFRGTALRTDRMLRMHNADASKLANSSCSPSLVKSLSDVVDVDLELTDTDDFVYVLDETEALVVQDHQHEVDDEEQGQEEEREAEAEEPAPEEITEDEIDFAGDKHVEVFEVDFDLPDEDFEEHEPSHTKANCIKLRGTHRPKTVNAALLCPICGKQLSTSNSYKYHMQLHGDDRPFVCKICGDSFKTRNAYDGHITLHNPNNPNKCRICGKTYRQASSLRSHLYSHSGVKPFTCNICGKGLTQKSGYKKHMLIHTGEKPYYCDTCGRNFRYSSNLIAHKRSHTRKSSPTKNALAPLKAHLNANQPNIL